MNNYIPVAFYVVTGGGWLHNLPMQGTAETDFNGQTIIVEEEAVINIESPFLELGVGYEWDGYHIELNRFGILDDRERSITTFRFYKKFEFK